jgi:hypothetical protein
MTPTKGYPKQSKSIKQIEFTRLETEIKKIDVGLNFVHLCKPRIMPANPGHFFHTVSNVLLQYRYLLRERHFIVENGIFTFDEHKTQYLEKMAVLQRKAPRCVQNAIVVINEKVPKHYPSYFGKVQNIVQMASDCGIGFYLDKSLRDRMILEKLKS